MIHFCLQGKTGFPSFRCALSSQRVVFGAGPLFAIAIRNFSAKVKSRLGVHNYGAREEDVKDR